MKKLKLGAKKSKKSPPKTKRRREIRALTKSVEPVEEVEGEPVSTAPLARRSESRQVTVHSGPGSFLQPSAEVQAIARSLIYDAKEALARGLAGAAAHGEAGPRFTLENDDEVAAARLLEHEGRGTLSQVPGKGARSVCIVHQAEWPCQMETENAKCSFRTEGENEWVFEFGSAGLSDFGGVLRRGRIDE